MDLQSRYFASHWYFSIRSKWEDLPHTKKVKRHPRDKNFVFRALPDMSLISHIYRSWLNQVANQVWFKCLFTPVPGPDNKPLRFVVHGSHSYEQVGFKSLALLDRYHLCGGSSLSFWLRSFCPNKYGWEHPRQCESGTIHMGGQVLRRSPHEQLTHNTDKN